MDKPTELLTDLGKALGIDLVFDENNQCFLLLDERLMISIRKMDNRFVLYGMLGEFPEGKPATFWQKLLVINLVLAETGEGNIALEASADAVMLIKAIPTDTLTVSALEELISHFISRVEKLVTVLAEEDDDLPTLDHSLFMEYEQGKV